MKKNISVLKESLISINRLHPIVENIISLSNSLDNKTIYNNATIFKLLLKECNQYFDLMLSTRFGVKSVNFYTIMSSYAKIFNSTIDKKNRRRVSFYIEDWEGDDKPSEIDKNEAFTIRNCNAYFEIIPTQLIDNAFKYSPSQGVITVSVKKTKYGKQLSISNEGPHVYDDEIESIMSSQRGKNAILSSVSGQGIGLDIVTKIFKSHKLLNPDIEIATGKINRTMNNVEQSTFTITLFYNDEINRDLFTTELSNEVSSSIITYIYHEFVRILPLLMKSCLNTYSETHSRSLNLVDIRDDLQKNAYELKDILINLLCLLNKNKIIYISQYSEVPYHKTYTCFKNLFINELNYLSCLNDVNFTYNGNLKNFEIFPLSINCFIHLLAKCIMVENKSMEVAISMYDTFIEILLDQSIDNKLDMEALDSILSIYNMDIDVTDSVITISLN